MAFALNKLHSLFVEQTNVNGSVLTVHYLVKNSPFRMDFQMDAAAVEGLKLKLYTHDTDREVKLAKNEPLTFRVLPTTSVRNCVSVEVRIQVLSSSMEGSLFVIVAEKGNSRLSTQPLKVVSKLEQVRAAIKRAGGAALGSDEQSSDDEMTVDEAAASAPNLKKRKVPVSDQVLHELEVIKKQQQEQFALISALSKMVPSPFKPELVAVEDDAAFSRATKRRKIAEIEEPASAVPSLEQSLTSFLTAFAALPAEERNTRVACLMAGLSPALSSVAAEAGSVLMQSVGPSSDCVPNCPFRRQMNSIFSQLVEEPSSADNTPDFASTGFPDRFTSDMIHCS